MARYRTDEYGYPIHEKRAYGAVDFIIDLLCVAMGLFLGVVLFIVLMNAFGHSVVEVNFIDRYL